MYPLYNFNKKIPEILIEYPSGLDPSPISMSSLPSSLLKPTLETDSKKSSQLKKIILLKNPQFLDLPILMKLDQNYPFMSW